MHVVRPQLHAHRAEHCVIFQGLKTEFLSLREYILDEKRKQGRLQVRAEEGSFEFEGEGKRASKGDGYGYGRLGG